jgi:hypothetical protein
VLKIPIALQITALLSLLEIRFVQFALDLTNALLAIIVTLKMDLQTLKDFALPNLDRHAPRLIRQMSAL